MALKISYSLLTLSSVFSLSSFVEVQGQHLEVSAGITYGSFKMEEVISFQQEIVRQLPVSAQTMSDFPNHYGFESKFTYKLSQFSLGLFGSFISSGSRVSYNDYSGSFEYNQIAKLTQLGLSSEYFLSKNTGSDWQFSPSLQVGIGKTSFNINDQMIVGGSILLEDNLNFTSSHITINPGFNIRRTFNKFFIKTNFGYLIDLPGFLEYSEDKRLNLINENKDPIGVDWSGFRISLSTGIRF